VPSLRRKHTNLRSIFESCAGNAKIVDWLAERSRFELSGDFERKQFGATGATASSCRRNS
jgi:hypothetical protein